MGIVRWFVDPPKSLNTPFFPGVTRLSGFHPIVPNRHRAIPEADRVMPDANRVIPDFINWALKINACRYLPTILRFLTFGDNSRSPTASPQSVARNPFPANATDEVVYQTKQDTGGAGTKGNADEGE